MPSRDPGYALGRAAAVAFLALIGALSVWFGSHAVGVGLDRDNSSMNARSPAQRAIYDDFRRTFGGDEAIVLAIGGLDFTQPAALRRLDRTTRRVEQIDGVLRALSLTSARALVAGESGAEDVPLVPRAVLEGDSIEFDLERALRNMPMLDALFVASDRRTAAIVAELSETGGAPSDSEPHARAVGEIRRLALELRGEGLEAFVSGLSVQKQDAARLVARDQSVLLPLSVLVLATALALSTRRRSGVLFPLAVTAVSLTWTLGAYAALGYKLNIITSLLAPVILALSIPTSVHLYQTWVAVGAAELGETRPVRRVLSEMWSPCVLTALTTAAGLASLGVSEVPAVQQFGLFAALGVGLSLLFNLTLLPLALTLIRRPAPRPPHGRRLERALAPVARLTTDRPGTVLLVGMLLTALVAPGLAMIRVDTDLLGFLGRDEPLRRETAEIDRRFGGSNTIDLIIQRRDGRPLTTLADLQSIQRFHETLLALDEVAGVLGWPDLLIQLHRADSGASDGRLPDEPVDLEYYLELIEQIDRRDELDRVVEASFSRARTNLRVRASGTAAALLLIERIEHAAAEQLGPDWSVTPTGAFYLVAMDSDRLVAGQLRSFALALGAVFLALAFVFRSWRTLAASLVPNLVPIVWTAGAMGWLGVPLSAATAMVASVVIGIAVDDTIHYLTRFGREHRGDVRDAVRRTTLTTGRVLLITSSVLALGFWVGAVGSFKPTIYFSLLSGVTILGALVCDLLLLPACLVLFHPRPSRA